MRDFARHFLDGYTAGRRDAAPEGTPMPHDLADLLAEIVEAGGSHPADQGLTETLDREGYTAAGKRLLAEQWREMAVRERESRG